MLEPLVDMVGRRGACCEGVLMVLYWGDSGGRITTNNDVIAHSALKGDRSSYLVRFHNNNDAATVMAKTLAESAGVGFYDALFSGSTGYQLSRR